MKTIQIVQHRHVEGRGDGALFLVTADVEVVVVGAAIDQPVDRWIGKDDWLVSGAPSLFVLIS